MFASARKFFYSLGFSFTKLHDSQDSRGRRKAISLIPLYHFHLLHRHLDTSRVITAKSSPLQ